MSESNLNSSWVSSKDALDFTQAVFNMLLSNLSGYQGSFSLIPCPDFPDNFGSSDLRRVRCIVQRKQSFKLSGYPGYPRRKLQPQFLNENYNQHSNANCQCQGRFDAKRDLPGSFQIGKTGKSGIRFSSPTPTSIQAWLDMSWAGTTLPSGHSCARLSDQTRPCQCPLPLSILTRAHFKGPAICKRR